MKKIFFVITIISALNASSEWDSFHYSSTSEEIQKTQTLKQFGELLQLSKDDHLIDIGCGDGATTLWLAQFVSSVRGIEPDSSMLNSARKQCKDTPNIELSQQSVEQLDAIDEFEAATCFWVLHWVDDTQKAVTNVFNCLRKNGTFYLATMVDEGSFIKSFNHVRSQPAWRGYFKEYKPPFTPPKTEALHEYLKKAGFSIISFERKRVSDHYNSQDQMMQEVLSYPFFASIKDPLQKKQMVKEVLQHYISNYCEIHKDGALSNSNDPIVVTVCVKEQ